MKCKNCRKRKSKLELKGSGFCEDCYWEIKYQQSKLRNKKIQVFVDKIPIILKSIPTMLKKW